MRSVLSIIFLLLLSFAVYARDSIPQPVTITGMRISPSTMKTIMTFELSATTSGAVKFKPKENILLLTFTNAGLRFKVNNARLGGANVASFSAEETRDHSVLFTIHTTGAVTWKTEMIVDPKTNRAEMQLEINSEAPREVPPEKVTGRARLEVKPVVENKNKTKLFTVVIDAGHGGKDTGALGNHGEKEKDVVLGISKKIASRLGKMKGIRVILTRNSDHYIPLRTRLNIARRSNADLFIAVHADAYFNNRARGASVYALSKHGATNEASRWLAKQERYAELDGIEFDRLADQSRMVRSVLIDLAQTATIRDSLHLGNKVLNALEPVSRLHYRQVEQAPFVVLKSPDIPSILVETGFISNPAEAAELTSNAYQEKLAAAVCRGVNSYVHKYVKH